MRPFIWRGANTGRWYVGLRDNAWHVWPGTSWDGHPTLGDAIDATLPSLAEPS